MDTNSSNIDQRDFGDLNRRTKYVGALGNKTDFVFLVDRRK